MSPQRVFAVLIMLVAVAILVFTQGAIWAWVILGIGALFFVVSGNRRRSGGDSESDGGDGGESGWTWGSDSGSDGGSDGGGGDGGGGD